MAACQMGYNETVKVLLDKGVKVNLLENNGISALKHAKMRKIRKLLRIAGATKNI